MSSGTPALSLFNTEHHRPPTATFSNYNAVSFLDQSTQHFDIGPYKPTFRKHRSNIGSHIYVACLIATFMLFPIYPSRPIESASCRPFYFQSILRDRLNLRLADPQVYDFPLDLHSIHHSVAKFCLTCPCQITATTNVMNHFCTRYALFACSFKYCHLLELCKMCSFYRTFISPSFVRGNNSNDLVALAGWLLTRMDTQQSRAGVLCT